MALEWDEKNTPNFEALIRRLGKHVVHFRLASADMLGISHIRLLSNQKKFFTGLIYIGAQRDFLKMQDARFYSGSILLACEAKESLLCSEPRLANVTCMEISCGVAPVFNALNQILSRDIIHIEGDTRAPLLRLWDRIMSNSIISNRDVKDALTEIGVKIKPFFRVSAVTLRNSGQGSDLITIRDALDSLLPMCEIFCYDQKVVILHFEESRRYEPDIPKKEVEEMLRRTGAVMMTGYAMRKYEYIRTQYGICSRCLDLAIHLCPENGKELLDVYSYTNQLVISMCARQYAQDYGNMDVLTLVTPSIVMLRRYDQAHKSDLLDVLHCYLINSGNLSQTAKDLFMHRNTVSNKLAKIKSMIPHDLENGLDRHRLLFAYDCLDYYEKILQFDLKQ